MGSQDSMMDYYCSKFGGCRFSHFGISCGQTDTKTHMQTDADERFTPATLVDVSNNKIHQQEHCFSFLHTFRRIYNFNSSLAHDVFLTRPSDSASSVSGCVEIKRPNTKTAISQKCMNILGQKFASLFNK